MKSILHSVFGTCALLLVLTFWISTLISEIFLSIESIVLVKQTIVKYGLLTLVLMMIGVGSSGFSLAKGRKGKIIEGKKKRMPIVAANGLLIMIPSAIFLSWKASAKELDFWFYLIQGLELLVGVMQLSLLGKSFLDGLRLTGKLRKKSMNVSVD